VLASTSEGARTSSPSGMRSADDRDDDKVSNPRMDDAKKDDARDDAKKDDARDDARKDDTKDDAKKDDTKDDAKKDDAKDDNTTGGDNAKGDDKDFNWITSEIAEAMSSECQPIDKILDLIKEKGVYLRPMVGAAAKPLDLSHQQKYVEQVWPLISSVFGKEIMESEPVSGHPILEKRVKKFLYDVYTDAVKQILTMKDLVILTSLTFYNHKSLSSLLGPGTTASTGGFTGISKEDFHRLNGSSIIHPNSCGATGDLYKLLDDSSNEDAISASVELYKQMLSSTKPGRGDASMTSVLSLYNPSKYKLSIIADNGISGADLIDQLASSPCHVIDLIRMAYFHNKLSESLVNLLNTDD